MPTPPRFLIRNSTRVWGYSVSLLFNDTESDCVHAAGRDGKNHAFKIVTYDEGASEIAEVDESSVARQGFGRGLCPVADRFVAGGSSPSTISLYDLETNQTVGTVNLSVDVRNGIHDLQMWPYGD